MKYGFEHIPLSDQKLAQFRDNFTELQMIIIDEMSLVGCDMLYRIHRRLREILQCDDLFANLSILLVGDLLQLPLVKATYIFDCPKSKHFAALHADTPLWKSFTPIVLKENHRQKDEKTWVETLNRFREGIITQDDEALLKTRLSDEDFLEQDALHVFYTNKEVGDHNSKMLNGLDSGLVSVKAIKRGPRGYIPDIKGHGTIDDTQMMDVLTLKVGARAKLTSNINTCDSLVNGVFGTVVGIERNMGGEIEFIVISFDDPKIGEQQRQKFFQVSTKYTDKNGTPITRHELEHIPRSMSGYAHSFRCKIIQFPLKLAWASTAHSMQGVTVKKGSKLIVHWHKKLKEGMAYVMLGRCERLEDIFISKKDFDIAKIRAKPEALEQSQKILEMYENRMEKRHNLENCFKVSYQNIRSLWAHLEDVKKSPFLMSSTVFGLGETWMDPDTTIDIPGFQGFFESKGRGKGVAAFSREEMLCLKSSNETFSGIKVCHRIVDIIFLYISKQFIWAHLREVLDNWISQDRPTIIIGDMNWHWSEECSNPMKDYLNKRKLTQLVKKSTHDHGHCLDHIYVNNQLLHLKPKIDIQSSYYSDHDILCMYFPNIH